MVNRCSHAAISQRQPRKSHNQKEFVNPVIIDVILVVISILLIWGGYKQGFIRAAGSLLGLVASIALGIWGVTWIENLTGLELTNNTIVFVFVFLTLAIFISQIIRVIFSALDLVRRLMSIIPFVGLINSLLGAVLGVVQALILIAAVSYVTTHFLPMGKLHRAMLESTIVGTSVKVSDRIDIF